MMKLSIIIPAFNEEGSIRETVADIYNTLTGESIDHEIIVVNDNSTDNTKNILRQLAKDFPTFRYVNNKPPNGIGLAIKKGLEAYRGDAVAIVMADGSDSPEDIVAYYRQLESGYECVFGSRFIKGGQLINYPRHKLVLNRLANWFIMLLFRIRFNDTTNAFKCYRREVIDGIRPILSYHFNITVELPLKAIVRNYSYAVVPIRWKNRKHGISKLKIKEMGSRYLFTLLYVFLEKSLSRGDYRRPAASQKNKGILSKKEETA
jgi:dolichol-phosphate mannosyltransferase